MFSKIHIMQTFKNCCEKGDIMNHNMTEYEKMYNFKIFSVLIFSPMQCIMHIIHLIWYMCFQRNHCLGKCFQMLSKESLPRYQKCFQMLSKWLFLYQIFFKRYWKIHYNEFSDIFWYNKLEMFLYQKWAEQCNTPLHNVCRDCNNSSSNSSSWQIKETSIRPQVKYIQIHKYTNKTKPTTHK